jgi:hypothetical protein
MRQGPVFVIVGTAKYASHFYLPSSSRRLVWRLRCRDSWGLDDWRSTLYQLGWCQTDDYSARQRGFVTSCACTFIARSPFPSTVKPFLIEQ